MDKTYFDYYIEIMTSTLTDAIQKNISLQANARISDVAIGQLNEKVLELEAQLDNTNYEAKINELNQEISRLGSMKAEYENIKHQANHVDTFRSELLKAREETQQVRDEYENKIKELTDKIAYLQLTPAKRKKIDDLNKKPEEPAGLDVIIEDGGSF